MVTDTTDLEHLLRSHGALSADMDDNDLLLIAELKAWRKQSVEERLQETCREWPDGEIDRCNKPAEFILWGKMFAREALGPRCYEHAVQHTHHSMPARVDQWAVFDLRVKP